MVEFDHTSRPNSNLKLEIRTNSSVVIIVKLKGLNSFVEKSPFNEETSIRAELYDSEVDREEVLKKQGGNSQNFLRKLLKILGLLILKVYL